MASMTDRLTSQEKARVSQAVASAEAKTHAEIVPVVAASSGRYDRPEDIVGVWFAVIGLIKAWWLMPIPQTEPGSWNEWSPIWYLVVMVFVVVMGFSLGTALAIRINWLRKLFTSERQMNAEVWQRARYVFFDQRVHHTTAAAGVLIYISLFERQAVILGDQSIIDKLGQETLDGWCAHLAVRLKEQKLTEALCETIAEVGEKLAAAFPVGSKTKPNQLSDALVLLEAL